MNTAIIGNIVQLPILRLIEHGAILDGDDLGDILLPQRYILDEYQEGDEVEVFVYFDSEDRIVATTEIPLVKRNQFAFLDVMETNRVGAFMNWGLSKDLLVPFREQKSNIVEDGNYLTFCYYDPESNRLVGSTKVEKFLDNIPPDFALNDKVEVLLTEEHELGYKLIVDNQFSGMLYKSDTFSQVYVGLKTTAYVKKVREDDKIDVSLQPSGVERTTSQENVILSYLQAQNGFMTFTDKSSPEEIYAAFEMSKKTFKKVIGALYKSRLVSIEKDGVYLITED